MDSKWTRIYFKQLYFMVQSSQTELFLVASRKLRQQMGSLAQEEPGHRLFRHFVISVNFVISVHSVNSVISVMRNFN